MKNIISITHNIKKNKIHTIKYMNLYAFMSISRTKRSIIRTFNVKRFNEVYSLKI